MSKLPFANKDFGQHFLTDQTIIQAITNDFKDQAKGIIEVGPGPAILTEHLSEHKIPLRLFEIDTRFKEYLEQFVSEENIIFGDALEANFSKVIENEFDNQATWLVSNLPYNVSVPLLIKFIQTPKIEMMTLMFQKEVALRVTNYTHQKKYASGSLMALSQNYFECKLLKKVPPGSFSPPPKVESTVLSFKRIEKPVIPLSEFKNFESFLRNLFKHRRKQMGKVLNQSYDESQVTRCLQESGLEKTLRAETLNLEKIQLLYRSFYPL